MPNVREIHLASMRRLWRANPAAAMVRHPNVVSRVFLNPDGDPIAITRLAGGRISVLMPTGAVSFVRLDG